MDDMIYRQSAIDALDGEISVTGRANAEAILGYVKLVADRIKRLPAQPEQRWVPVSEKLPEEDFVDVLVTDDSGGLATIGTDCVFTREATGEREWLASQRVTAWMPCPEPYKGGKNDGKIH